MSTGTVSRLAGLSFVNPHLATSGALAGAFRTVPAGGRASLPGRSRPLDVPVAGAGRLLTLPEWNAATSGTSLVVVVRGRVVHEWYADGLGADDLFLGASMTKSALAHLVGTAVAAGALRLEDRVADHVPELASSGWASCRVLDVLRMTSGVDWVEDHRDPDGPASRLLACFAGPDGGDSRDLLRGIGARHAPGTRWEYSTADSQVLDWVRERATGTTYDRALGELWRTLGCTADAVVGVDGRGAAMAGGSLAATARDWARVAMLQLDGTVMGRRVLDPAWLETTCRPSLPFLRPGRLPSTITAHAGFGGHWWPLDDDGRRVTADGSRGQFGYADRDLAVAVVKTSQWPYEDVLTDRAARDLSYLGLPEVAGAAYALSQTTTHHRHDEQEEAT